MDNHLQKLETTLGIPNFRLLGENDKRKYGTSLQGYITTTFRDLVKVFGAPQESDGYKVSGEWTFQDQFGNEFTIYDWKCTNLYDSEYPTVSEMRNSTSPMTFNIGGFNKESARVFIKALEDAVPGLKGEGR